MPVAMLQLFFIITLLEKLRQQSSITHHTDIITLETIALRLGFDLKSVEIGFSLTTPLQGIRVIKKELLSELEDLASDIKGLETLIPMNWELGLTELLKESSPGYHKYVVDGKVLVDELFEDLYHHAMDWKGEENERIVRSANLTDLKTTALVDLNYLNSCLASDLTPDLVKAKKCLTSFMVVYVIADFFNKDTHLIQSNELDPVLLYNERFEKETEAVILLMEAFEEFEDTQKEPTKEALDAYEVLVKGCCYSKLVDLEKINPKQLSDLKQLYLLRLTGNEDFKETVKRIATSAAEMLNKMLKAIKERFEERKKEGSKEAESIKAAIDKAVADLKGKNGEVKESDLVSLKKQFDKADFKDHSSKLDGIKTQSELATVLSAMSAKMAVDIQQLKKAEAKIKEAESLVVAASKEPAGVNSDATAENQSQFKTQMKEAKENATKALSGASKAIGESLKSMAALRAIRVTLERISKGEEPEEVTGNESWKY